MQSINLVICTLFLVHYIPFTFNIPEKFNIENSDFSKFFKNINYKQTKNTIVTKKNNFPTPGEITT